ncbi:MAG: DUF1329 domain-containing protein [Pseudomonadota bacterium]
MLKKTLAVCTALVLAFGASEAAFAKVPADAAKELKSSLTPFGALRAGNGKDIMKGEGIPDWTGGITKAQIPASYKKAGQHHPDPYASDKPLFVIDGKNYKQYADRLPKGMQALFETYPATFRMPVFQSRRSHSAPDWVNDNTFRNATTGELIAGGNGIDNVYGGIPFPIPSGSNEQQALQIVWNHTLRWRSVFVVRRAAEVAVQRNGDYSLVVSQQEVYFRFYNPKGSPKDLADNVSFYYLAFTKSPPRLAGGAVLVHETIDQKAQPRQAWGYNAGQRRVRRAPNLAYDTPIAAADGLRTADDTDMYNGSPDRYDWKVVGKKEMYIPYNSFKMDSPDVKYSQLLTKNHPNPDFARYELHRVWIVEATLKPGARHLYSKRTFYIDEDSWSITVADQYDNRGELWRVSEAFLKNYYEVPVTWTALDVFHDLKSKRYHVQNLDNEEDTTLDFSQAIPSDSYFSPAALRRRGR